MRVFCMCVCAVRVCVFICAGRCDGVILHLENERHIFNSKQWLCIYAQLFIKSNNNSKLVDRLLFAYIIILIEFLLITTSTHKHISFASALQCTPSIGMQRKSVTCIGCARRKETKRKKWAESNAIDKYNIVAEKKNCDRDFHMQTYRAARMKYVNEERVVLYRCHISV